MKREKKRKRPWLSMEESEIPDLPLADVEILPSLLHLSLDKWTPNKRFGGGGLKTWARKAL